MIILNSVINISGSSKFVGVNFRSCVINDLSFDGDVRDIFCACYFEGCNLESNGSLIPRIYKDCFFESDIPRKLLNEINK